MFGNERLLFCVEVKGTCTRGPQAFHGRTLENGSHCQLHFLLLMEERLPALCAGLPYLQFPAFLRHQRNLIGAQIEEVRVHLVGLMLILLSFLLDFLNGSFFSSSNFLLC